MKPCQIEKLLVENFITNFKLMIFKVLYFINFAAKKHSNNFYLKMYCVSFVERCRFETKGRDIYKKKVFKRISQNHFYKHSLTEIKNTLVYYVSTLYYFAALHIKDP